jgi:hypothetical protein
MSAVTFAALMANKAPAETGVNGHEVTVLDDALRPTLAQHPYLPYPNLAHDVKAEIFDDEQPAMTLADDLLVRYDSPWHQPRPFLVCLVVPLVTWRVLPGTGVFG